MLTKIMKRKLSGLNYLFLDIKEVKWRGDALKKSPKMHKETGYETKKHSMFCSAKDTIPTFQESNVNYWLTFPGCNENYIGKTDLITCLHEHGSHDNQSMHQDLLKYMDIVNLMK